MTKRWTGASWLDQQEQQERLEEIVAGQLWQGMGSPLEVLSVEGDRVCLAYPDDHEDYTWEFVADVREYFTFRGTVESVRQPR